MKKINYGLMGALLFGAISNFLFFGPHEWKENLSEIEAVGGSSQFEILPKEIDLLRIKNTFRNSSPRVAISEKDALEAALAEKQKVYKDDWKLIGSILEEDVRKAFIISSEGLVQEVGRGDSFGFDNKALRIEEKSLSYETKAREKKVLRLYEHQGLGGKDEKD